MTSYDRFANDLQRWVHVLSVDEAATFVEFAKLVFAVDFSAVPESFEPAENWKALHDILSSAIPRSSRKSPLVAAAPSSRSSHLQDYHKQPLPQVGTSLLAQGTTAHLTPNVDTEPQVLPAPKPNDPLDHTAIILSSVVVAVFAAFLLRKFIPFPSPT